MGAHFMPKNEKMAFSGRRRPPIQKLHKIKVVGNPPKWGPVEIRSDLRGRLRPISRSRLISLKGGPILTKFCMWCSFPMGSKMGGRNFYRGAQNGCPFYAQKWKMAKKGLRWPPIKIFHKIKVVCDPPKWRTGWGQVWPLRLFEANIKVATS